MKMVILGWVAGVASLAVIAAVLFGCAGRWDLPMYWVYLALFAAMIVAGLLLMDQSLIKERIRPGPGGKDGPRTAALVVLFLGQYAVAGLDVGHFHWSDTVPLAVQVLGAVVTAAAGAVQLWAVAVNRFFSSVIRIQADRGQYVVSTGPYRYVRHPAYATAPILFVGTGLTLGSWLATLLGALLSVPILMRAAREDRILREQLAGYADYARRVRYRVLPGVW